MVDLHKWVNQADLQPDDEWILQGIHWKGPNEENPQGSFRTIKTTETIFGTHPERQNPVQRIHWYHTCRTITHHTSHIAPSSGLTDYIRPWITLQHIWIINHTTDLENMDSTHIWHLINLEWTQSNTRREHQIQNQTHPLTRLQSEESEESSWINQINGVESLWEEEETLHSHLDQNHSTEPR